MLPHVALIWCEDWPQRVLFLQYKSRTYSPLDIFFSWQEKRGLYHIIETKRADTADNKPLDNVLTTEMISYLPGRGMGETRQRVYHCIKMYSGFYWHTFHMFTSARRHTQYCTSLKVLAQNITQNYQTKLKCRVATLEYTYEGVTDIIYKIR